MKTIILFIMLFINNSILEDYIKYHETGVGLEQLVNTIAKDKYENHLFDNKHVLRDVILVKDYQLKLEIKSLINMYCFVYKVEKQASGDYFIYFTVLPSDIRKWKSL